jgi:hypothetical protein
VIVARPRSFCGRGGSHRSVGALSLVALLLYPNFCNDVKGTSGGGGGVVEFLHFDGGGVVMAAVWRCVECKLRSSLPCMPGALKAWWWFGC